MNIGVDAREIQEGVITGIGRSLANFIEYFGKKEKIHQLFLISEKQIPVQFNGNIKRIVIRPTYTFIWDQVKLPLALRKYNINLFYSPYYKIPLLSSRPAINQILDLMYLE